MGNSCFKNAWRLFALMWRLPLLSRPAARNTWHRSSGLSFGWILRASLEGACRQAAQRSSSCNEVWEGSAGRGRKMQTSSEDHGHLRGAKTASFNEHPHEAVVDRGSGCERTVSMGRQWQGALWTLTFATTCRCPCDHSLQHRRGPTDHNLGQWRADHRRYRGDEG